MLSFELGLLWPEFMGTFGAVIGLPFTLEGFAFFLEAIFAGIYLYGWDRLPPRVHWLTGFPIALSGLASAWFVVTANAWMNSPQGFTLRDGVVVDADPLAAMLNPATGAQTVHMILAAYMVTGFVVAAFYAWERLRGRDGLYQRRAMALGLALGALCTPAQIVAGDWAARMVAATQPVKLAAMEGQFRTEARAPLRIGGWPDEQARGSGKEVPAVLVRKQEFAAQHGTRPGRLQATDTQDAVPKEGRDFASVHKKFFNQPLDAASAWGSI